MLPENPYLGTVRYRHHEPLKPQNLYSSQWAELQLKALTLAISSLLIAAAAQARAQAVAPAGLQSAALDTANVVLSPGDAIRITVWRNAELSGDFTIAPDGSITHPLYRELKVAGVPLPVVEDRVRTFLSRFESNPAFVILPMIRIVVSGEVRQPNIIAVPIGTSVVEAIAQAGGPTERGRMDRVRLVRESGSYTLDLRRPDAGGSRVFVRSGDQIIVTRSTNIMQDYVIPSSSILAGLAAVTTVILQLRR